MHRHFVYYCSPLCSLANLTAERSSQAEGQRLDMVHLHTHAAFTRLYPRLYKFLDPDQSCRDQAQFLTLEGTKQDFTMPIQVGVPPKQHARAHGKTWTAGTKRERNAQ